jgi:AcrR family transcriptional regulator
MDECMMPLPGYSHNSPRNECHFISLLTTLATSAKINKRTFIYFVNTQPPNSLAGSMTQSSPDDPTSKGDRTRQALLDAAYQQFVQRGFHGASMRAIADGAGITPGGIYNHFAGKDELFAEVVVAHHPLTRIFPRLIAAPGDSAEERLRNAAQAIASELESDEGLLNLFFIEMIECEGKHLALLSEAFMPKALAFITELHASVETPPGITPFGLLQTFVGTVLATVFTRRFLASAGVPTSALVGIDKFMDIYLHGILRQE